MSLFALVDFPLEPGASRSLDAPRQRLAFGAPREWIVARELCEVRVALNAAQRAAQAGAWCVGYVRFEAAPAFDSALRTHAPDGPLVCFAVFDRAQAWPESSAAHLEPPYSTADWSSPLSSTDFEQGIARIHDAIRAGEVYQVNYTTPLHSLLSGDALAYFHALHRSQPNGYAVYLDTRQATADLPGERVLSVSPELFFDWHGDRITTQPMKGTAARGLTPRADADAAATLRGSDKERAENLMIVDLLRNDLARIARTGSVAVPALFELQALPTVWQMTSTVTALTRDGLNLADVFGALFPCGSVTGAPKVRAMHHIAELERAPRGVYCGAVGVIAPGGRATFNVPIRTVTLHQQGGSTLARCGVGSGITIDAHSRHEAQEWRNKQRFLERAAQPFKLLESLRLEDGLIWLLPEHLERLERSAAALNVTLDEAAIRAALRQVARQHPRGVYKLRLLVAHNGHIELEAQPLPGTSMPLRLNLATQPIEVRGCLHAALPSDFVRNKTTRREIYAAHAPQDGAFDTLLWNEAGELTECTIGNIALRVEGLWLTPPSAAGLLPGTYRQRLLAQGALQEAPLTRADLLRADAVAFFNSVRGWLPADLPRLQKQARAALATAD
ncbi:aminodeoxychorismate synthase component I [Aquabacterium sp.]|uniref:aminodeoxychorismate synthase component I n=1 Tax=Aquabacterium sp. TaxID=1872578 RepID=UPI0035AFF12B